MQSTSRTSSDPGSSGLVRSAGPPAGTRVARRTALRGGVGAVLLVPGSALLAACAASRSSRSAAPGPTKAKTVITMNGIFGTGQQRLQTMISLYEEAFAPFLQKNPYVPQYDETDRSRSLGYGSGERMENRWSCSVGTTGRTR